MKTIASSDENAKTVTAIECGTLEVFLHLLTRGTTVLLTPISRLLPHTGLYKQQDAIHITALTASQTILFATFPAAQSLGVPGTTISLIEPFKDQAGREQTLRLTAEMSQCLQHLIQAHPHVRDVQAPARYRLPDEWIWSVHSLSPRIVLQDRHWTIEK